MWGPMLSWWGGEIMLVANIWKTRSHSCGNVSRKRRGSNDCQAARLRNAAGAGVMFAKRLGLILAQLVPLEVSSWDGCHLNGCIFPCQQWTHNSQAEFHWKTKNPGHIVNSHHFSTEAFTLGDAQSLASHRGFGEGSDLLVETTYHFQ